MFFANEDNGNRIHIDDVDEKKQYYCPSCGEKLFIKNKGEIIAHHFSHYQGTICKDSWHYDMSLWHINWQNRFPRSCQEIVKKIGEQKHRADILIENSKTVIEFQHSDLSKEEFIDRNTFYNELGYKVVWVFDVAEQYNKETITESYNYMRGTSYLWKYPKRTLLGFDISDKVELYLQIENRATDDKIIIDYLKNNDDESYQSCFGKYYEEHKDDKGILKKVNWISSEGIKEFSAYEDDITIEEFVDNYSYGIESRRIINDDNLFDYLKFLRRKDHSEYYDGCPISSTGQCVSSTIDTPESQYDKIRPCELCEYKGKKYMTCKKRILDLKLPNNSIIRGFNRNAGGFIDKIKYEINGEVKVVELATNYKKKESISYGNNDREVGTIIDLWEQNNLSIATFLDIRNNRYVRINKNPREQMKKYRKIYGKISQDQYSFRGESMEIYYTDEKRWVLVWGGRS